MKPAMYIFINKGLRMSPGKIAAQAGHAALEAGLLSHPKIVQTDPLYKEKERALSRGNKRPLQEFIELWNEWRNGLHYAKYVMEARDSEHLRDIERYLNDRGFRTVLILDEGHTEVAPISPTALGVALVDKDDMHTAATFSSFKLYKEPRPEPPAPNVTQVYKPDPSAKRLYRNGGVGGFLRAMRDIRDPGGRSSQ